jgi:hypothetical protein
LKMLEGEVSTEALMSLQRIQPVKSK